MNKRLNIHQKLKDQLKAGYEANANESLKLAADWCPLEEEAWHNSRGASERKK